jgi:hypothetical protein
MAEIFELRKKRVAIIKTSSKQRSYIREYSRCCLFSSYRP